MFKKADANMWWIIIGAVIALVVMVVLMIMFTDKTTTVEGGLLDCESKGGTCVGETTCRINYQGTVSSAFTCPDKAKPECCFGVRNAALN